MQINHKFEFVEGTFDTENEEIRCVGSKKYGDVNLCFKAGMNVPFAKIKLYSSSLAVDADACFDDAVNLGSEIEKRWNENADLKMRVNELENALRVVRTCVEIISMKGHRTGYDWNRDPATLTLIEGKISDKIAEALGDAG